MFNLQRSAASPLKVAALAVAATLASLLITQSLNAQSSNDKVSITVSPQSLDTAINVGQSTTNVFRITNTSAQAFSIEPTPKNFVPSGNEGAIKIEEEDTPYSLAKWITVSPSGPVTVQPKETADFNVTIAVPSNADPGGHFGSVVFRTLPSKEAGANAAISQEVAPVILVRVPGDVKEEATISSFRIPNSPVTKSGDINFESIVSNNGNVHVKPTGNVEIVNMFGKAVGATQVEGRNVIPGADRKMTATWKKTGFRLGRYTARLTMVYGDENKIMTAQKSFFIVPLAQVVPVIVVLLLLLFIIFRIRRRLMLAFKILAGKHEAR